MSILKDPAILKAEKKIIDTYGLINKAAVDVLTILDPQQKNLFEILLIPEPYPYNRTIAPLDLATQVAKSIGDTAICKFYVQQMDIPHSSIEYGRFDALQAATDITYADECTITFLESELSLVRIFLKNWMDLTYKKDTFSDGYVFADNQWIGRKKAIIFPQSRTGIPNLVWLELRGMRFKFIENFQFDQAASDPMMISVTFACDDIYLNSLI